MLLLSAGIAAEAMSYSFVSKASGRLGGPIRFEFYRDSTTRPQTDIKSFTVSTRTADDRWKAMWSILGGHGLTRPIEYGVTPPGFTTTIQPQKLIPGRVYTAFASDGHGGSSGVTFGFGKNGKSCDLRQRSGNRAAYCRNWIEQEQNRGAARFRDACKR